MIYLSFPRTSLFSGFARLTALACLTSVSAFAQQADAKVPTLDLSHPSLSLQAALKSPLDFSPAAESTSSSSNLTTGLSADPGISADLQPPPRRRRYGRPNYSDKYRNADGSNRFAFVAGGGFTVPIGDASANYLKTNWRFEVGAGVNMSKKLGVLFQFDYDHFGVPDNVLANQEALYNSFDPSGQNSFSNLGGNAHIWSFTLNPTINLYQGDSFGAYGTVGGGFYHKVTNFTVPTTGVAYDPYYGYYQYQADQVVDDYTSNAPGATGGVGITYKFSRWSNERLFAEARYVHTFNQARLGDPGVTHAGSGTFNNFYPPNSNETSYIPITFGIRF